MSSEWLPAADVLAYLKIEAGTDNAEVAELCRIAAGRLVERKRKDLALAGRTAEDVADTDPDVRHGALLLTARLFARKGSPQGVATFGELGASMILRSDPDIALLLGIGRYGRPAVG